MTANKRLMGALVMAPLAIALGLATPSFSAQPVVLGETQVTEVNATGNAEMVENQVGASTEVGEAQTSETQVAESTETGEAQDSKNEAPDANESGEQAEGNAEDTN